VDRSTPPGISKSRFHRDEQEFRYLLSLKYLLLVNYRMAVPISAAIPNPSQASKSVWILLQSQVPTHYAPKLQAFIHSTISSACLSVSSFPVPKTGPHRYGMRKGCYWLKGINLLMKSKHTDRFS